jgi:hypothetical protein
MMGTAMVPEMVIFNHLTQLMAQEDYISMHGGDEECIQNFGETGIDERMLLRWTIGREDVRMWSGFIWLRIGASGMLLCNELPGSINFCEFLD